MAGIGLRCSGWGGGCRYGGGRGNGQCKASSLGGGKNSTINAEFSGHRPTLSNIIAALAKAGAIPARTITANVRRRWQWWRKESPHTAILPGCTNSRCGVLDVVHCLCIVSQRTSFERSEGRRRERRKGRHPPPLQRLRRRGRVPPPPHKPRP